MKSIFTTSDCLSLQQLQDYQDGRLSKAAQRRVEEHLIDCPLCDGALAGLEQSQDSHQDASQIRSLRFRDKSTFRFSRIAAILAIGIVLLAAFWFRPQLDNQSLFSSYYQVPQPTQVQLRGTPNDEAHQNIQSALAAYQGGKFKLAISLFEQHLETFPGDDQAYLWMSIAHLESGNDEKAIQLLQELKVKGQTYYEKASWYLTLAYIKKGEANLAEEVAKELKASGGKEFQEKLPQLLKKIKRLPE